MKRSVHYYYVHNGPSIDFPARDERTFAAAIIHRAEMLAASEFFEALSSAPTTFSRSPATLVRTKKYV